MSRLTRLSKVPLWNIEWLLDRRNLFTASLKASSEIQMCTWTRLENFHLSATRAYIQSTKRLRFWVPFKVKKSWFVACLRQITGKDLNIFWLILTLFIFSITWIYAIKFCNRNDRRNGGIIIRCIFKRVRQSSSRKLCRPAFPPSTLHNSYLRTGESDSNLE